MYANVDQLLNKKDDLEMLIADNNPDIMLFTEVIPKAQQNPIDENQIKIEGYEHYPNFNFSDKNLGSSGMRGVIIYVRDNISCKKVSPSSTNRDHIWVELNLGKNDILLCGCMYRSPTKEMENKKITTEEVSRVLGEMSEHKKQMIICGDFNYPEIDWEYEYVSDSHDVIRPFINAVQDNLLYQHIYISQPGIEPGMSPRYLT